MNEMIAETLIDIANSLKGKSPDYHQIVEDLKELAALIEDINLTA